jgi:hypothetical protein
VDQNRDLMAVEAIISELVSTRLFPVLRENTGKFAGFSHETRMVCRFRNVNSIAYHPNSLSIGSGKSFINREQKPSSREKVLRFGTSAKSSDYWLTSHGRSLARVNLILVVMLAAILSERFVYALLWRL